jgi:mlo protein
LQGKVALMSAGSLHQLHIFIFVLAVFHVSYSVLTMALGRLKVSSDPIINRMSVCQP